MFRAQAIRRSPLIFCLTKLGCLVFSCFAAFATAQAQVNITTEAYDNDRTAANLNETILSTSTVNANLFGKLFSQNVDGAIYAQPLYVQNLQINGVTHNVVFVATMNDSVYAFDADNNTGTNSAPLWFDNFTNPPPSSAPITDDINIVTGNHQVGIESTPVIDLTSGTMYVVALTSEASGYVYRLHALDILTGAEKFLGPVVISGSVAGSGVGSVNGTVTFNPNQHMQRPALAFVNGTVFVAFGSWGDQVPYFGWIMGYNGTTLAQTSIACTTPNANQGAIWMSGRGPVIDASGNIYYLTANGPYDGLTSFSDSLVKYSTLNGQLALTDWFTPDNFAALATNDEDFGSSGPIMLPGTGLIAAAGKIGTLYLMNSASLGHEQTGNGQIVQSLSIASSVYPAPVYYNRTSGAGPWLYVWPSSSYLEAFHFNGSAFEAIPASLSTFPAQSNSFSAALAISANANTPGSGILWAVLPATPNTYGNGAAPAILYAFDAGNLANVLWNSNRNSARDAVGVWSKFRSPVVANGKVYLGSLQNPTTGGPAALNVYGLLPTPTVSSAPTVSFLGTDSTTQGNWQGVYGTQGYSLANSAQILPANDTFSAQSSANWTWSTTTTDSRALQVPSGGRIAAAWYGGNPTFAVNLSDGQTYEISIYVVDWDNKGRSETINIIDPATGTVLDSETASNFANGVYFSWNVTGNVVISVSATSGPNAVLSAVFCSLAGSTGSPTSGSKPSGAASFVTLDSTSEGAWQGKYGTSGYDLVGVTPTIPSGTQFTVQNVNVWTWAPSTTDARALKLPGSQTTGIAATWYTGTGSPELNFTLSYSDGNPHQFALYAMDWDNKGRAESIQITDTSGHLLDSRSISNFTTGVYLSWNITGSVIVTISATSGPNAVASGIFLDPASGSAPPPPPVLTAQWSWPALAGASSYNVYRGAAASGPWTLLGSTTTSSYSDSTIVAGKTYYYEVNSVIAGVESSYVTFSIITPSP